MPVLATYGSSTASVRPRVRLAGGRRRAYHSFIDGFAQGIGAYRAVLFLEMDSLITVGCLTQHGRRSAMQELQRRDQHPHRDCPHVVVYLDAGAADALSAGTPRGPADRAGVSKIQGFFLNATHFDWTANEIRYGEKISRLTGGKHFVVNTAENGQGPLVPRTSSSSGNEVLCNPPGRGLGRKPTADTGFRNVDAFAWIDQPGRVGRRRAVPGAPPTGVFWPALRADAGAQRRASTRGSAGLGRG